MPYLKQTPIIVPDIPDLTNCIVKIEPIVSSKKALEDPKNNKVKLTWNVWKAVWWDPFLVRQDDKPGYACGNKKAIMEHYASVIWDGEKWKYQDGKLVSQLNKAKNLQEVADKIAQWSF